METCQVGRRCSSSHRCVNFVSRMAFYSQMVIVLLYAWSSLFLGYCAMLKANSFPQRRKVDFTHSVDKRDAVQGERDLLLQDTMTKHMQMLYAKYNRAGFPFRDGNTVRSFKAHWGSYPAFYARNINKLILNLRSSPATFTFLSALCVCPKLLLKSMCACFFFKERKKMRSDTPS